MGFLRLLFVPEAVCMLKLNSNHFWHASSAHIIFLAGCVFLTVNLSVIYIYVFIYLYSETSHVYVQSWGVIMAMFSPAKPHQGVEGVWSCCCPASAQFWLLLLWLGAFLAAYWPTCGCCGPFWVWSRAMGSPGEILSCLFLVCSPSAPEEPICMTWWPSCWLGPCSSCLSKQALPKP